MKFTSLLFQLFRFGSHKQIDRRRQIESYLNDFSKICVKIGKNVDTYDVSIDSIFSFLIEIGDDCLITGEVKILSHDVSLGMFVQKYKVGRTIIQDKVFIGMDAVIMPDVEIGPNATIGANSVVTKSTPLNSVASWCPVTGTRIRFSK